MLRLPVPAPLPLSNNQTKFPTKLVLIDFNQLDQITRQFRTVAIPRHICIGAVSFVRGLGFVGLLCATFVNCLLAQFCLFVVADEQVFLWYSFLLTRFFSIWELFKIIF